jgi:hypothetical protein
MIYHHFLDEKDLEDRYAYNLDRIASVDKIMPDDSDNPTHSIRMPYYMGVKYMGRATAAEIVETLYADTCDSSMGLSTLTRKTLSTHFEAILSKWGFDLLLYSVVSRLAARLTIIDANREGTKIANCMLTAVTAGHVSTDISSSINSTVCLM